MIQKPHPHGYTLIELAIVIAIVGLLIGAGVGIVQRKNEAERFRVTNEHLDQIEQALHDFYSRNLRLPCPAQADARIESDTTGEFGVEMAGYASGTCPNAPNDERGVVPVRTLGLPDDVMLDGWNRKISYQIASGMGSVDDFENQDNTANISVRDLDGYELTTINFSGNYGAAYVLVSHGNNGYRAWLPNAPGIDSQFYLDTDAATTDTLMGVEVENTDGDSNFLQDTASQIFDDIVRFKTKADLEGARRMVPHLHLHTRACQSARSIINNGLGAYAAGYAANATVIVNAATALDRLCNTSSLSTDSSDCAKNLDWVGEADLATEGKTYEDCYCTTDGQYYRTAADLEIFGGCS